MKVIKNVAANLHRPVLLYTLEIKLMKICVDMIVHDVVCALTTVYDKLPCHIHTTASVTFWRCEKLGNISYLYFVL